MSRNVCLSTILYGLLRYSKLLFPFFDAEITPQSPFGQAISNLIHGLGLEIGPGIKINSKMHYAFL